MGRKILFNISDLESQKLQGIANAIDLDSRKKYRDGQIDEKEAKKLRELLNGNQNLKSEFSESDIKKVFGYEGTVSQSTTTTIITPEAQDAQPAMDATKSKQEQFDEVKTAYYRYRGIDPVSRNPLLDPETGESLPSLSPQDAYEAVARDYKGNKAYKKAIKNLKKYSIDTEAKMVALEAISQSESTSSKKVKKDAKATIEEKYGKLDKHTKKALNGNGHNFWANALDWASLRDSDMKKLRKAQAYGNKANEKIQQTYTKEDFTNAVGKKSPLFVEDENGFMAIEKLTDVSGRQLVKRKDGKFDITALSEFIGSQIGADNTLSRQQNQADAEIEAIRAEFRKQGVDLTKRDTKQLVEFLGYNVERKNFAKMAYDGTLGAVAASAGTAVALATTPRHVFAPVFENNNHLEIILDNTDNASSILKLLKDEDFQKMLDAGQASQIQSGNITKIVIDEHQVQPFLYIASKNMLMNVIKSAGIGALTGLLAGMMSYGPSEEDIFSTRFECRSYEDFLRYVDARKELSDDQKQALKQIAMAYIITDENDQLSEIEVRSEKRDAKGALVLDENGNPIVETVKQMEWDCEDFKDFLNRQAGYKSNLNSIELLKATQNAPEIVNSTPVRKQETETVPTPTPVPTPVPRPEPKINVYISNDTVLHDFDKFNQANRHSWDDLTKMYECLNNLTRSEKIRFLKVMQGFKKNDFTYEQILEIVKISKPGYKITESIKAQIKALVFVTEDNFDVEMFEAHVNTKGSVGDDDGAIIALKEIKDSQGNIICTRNDELVTQTPCKKENQAQKTNRKGKTAGQYEEQRYWHRGASDNGAVRDADKAAQDTWARSQQNANVIRINGGKTALDEIE